MSILSTPFFSYSAATFILRSISIFSGLSIRFSGVLSITILFLSISIISFIISTPPPPPPTPTPVPAPVPVLSSPSAFGRGIHIAAISASRNTVNWKLVVNSPGLTKVFTVAWMQYKKRKECQKRKEEN
jgi:hypothetical protein